MGDFYKTITDAASNLRGDDAVPMSLGNNSSGGGRRLAGTSHHRCDAISSGELRNFRDSSQCLDVSGKSGSGWVYIWGCDGGVDQRWTLCLEKQSGGKAVVTVRNKKSDYVVANNRRRRWH